MKTPLANENTEQSQVISHHGDDDADVPASVTTLQIAPPTVRLKQPQPTSSGKFIN